MSIDTNNPEVLTVQDNGAGFQVAAVWDSGNGPYNIVVITTQPQPNNIYRCKPDGSTVDPEINVMSRIDADYKAARPYLPEFVVRTTNAVPPVLQVRARYKDPVTGVITYDNKNLAGPPVGAPFTQWPALPPRTLLYGLDE